MRVRKEGEGGFSARCVEIPAAITQGDTIEELKKNMVDAISLVLEYLESKKEEDTDYIIPIEVPPA
jgi:predicted RNase H-like HicB family nuclease